MTEFIPYKVTNEQLNNLLPKAGQFIVTIDDPKCIYMDTSDSFSGRIMITGYSVADESSITINDQYKIQLYDFKNAMSGQVPTKDTSGKVTWVTPVDSQQIQAAVTECRQSAVTAQNGAAQASGYAAQSLAALQQIQNTYWKGTLQQYNEIPVKDRNTLYFILDGDL